MLLEGGELLHRVGCDPALVAALSALPGQVERNAPLATLTTIGIGGPAAILFAPETADALVEAIAISSRLGAPCLVLGAGSNVLFPDAGYPGVVIVTRALSHVRLHDRTVDALCGVRLPSLLSALHDSGWHSLDFLSGIPGSVGGAIAMNAGIPARAIGDAVEAVTVRDADGAVRVLDRDACGFAYRGSAIRASRLPVVSALLRLDGPAFDGAALLAARRKRQPIAARTAGCVFKNPLNDSAGRLIEGAGLKGLRVGRAKVSELHANFIVNLGGARCAEIRKLIDIVHQKVYKSFQISLELEIEVIEG